MIINLWFFLSVVTVTGVILTMFGLHLEYKRKMKILEIDAAQVHQERSLSTEE